MVRTKRILAAAVFWTLILAGLAGAAEPVMKTESWPQEEAGFARFHERIARGRGRNLLRRPEVRLVEPPDVLYGTLAMLYDGSAGVRLGEGRVGLAGHPAVLTFYLGRPRSLTEVGLFTFNSDTRANQDFEVRFANNSAHPGVLPAFPEPPDLTTGPTLLGINHGGFHTYFRARDGGTLGPGPVDWVQFRIWNTYNRSTGTPAKAQNTADGWSSLIEIEVIGDEKDRIEIPEDDIERQEARFRQALAQTYRKKATWQETLLAVREALIRRWAQEDAGFQPYTSPLRRGGQEPLHLRVRVAGLKRLWLEADIGPDDYSADQAIWGDPQLIAPDGHATPLTDLQPEFVQVGWGDLGVDRDHWGQPLQVAQRRFSRGLWAHAPSQLCYSLDGKYEWFEAWVGIGVAAGSGGSSRFKVLKWPTTEAETRDLWDRLAQDFPDPVSRREMVWEREDGIWQEDWTPGDVKALAQRYAQASRRSSGFAPQAAALAETATAASDLERVRQVYLWSRRLQEALGQLQALSWPALRLAIADLTATFGEQYPQGPAYLKRLEELEAQLNPAAPWAATDSLADLERLEALVQEATQLQRTALLANPLLHFDQLLLVKRRADNLGLPANWQSNCSLPPTGYDNEIALLSMKDLQSPLRTLYKPANGAFVGDVDLHFDGDRLLFSSIGSNGRWHLFEMHTDGTGLRQVTPEDPPDVDYYDACYLPDGDLLFCSTASFTGVPCVFGSSHVAMLYRMKPDGTGIRQLCFEQDHDWCPTLLHDGRVLYSRWEYTDTPHSNTRLLFHMNPDGTQQMAYYGSNSPWPNAIFYARPIPGHPTKVVGIVSGHHGDARMGELVIFDPAQGQREAEGVVQRIPGYGKRVEPIFRDQLTTGLWPKFLHPYPLSEKYFLVSCQPTPQSNWGLYLVDVFDNLTLLREEPGYALLEPIPLRPTPRPPVLEDRVPRDRTDALVYLADVYEGPGLQGIPRGTVKRLRVFTYHFAYHDMGGLLGVVGLDGPWDIKRVLGTVPVEEDGSALFRVPANTPLSVQPLDAEGKALQLMRSWMTAMPGEVLSCVGCHEPPNTSAPLRRSLAATKPPSEIQPWYGPTRGFSYPREVQPVIDRYCIRCHDGQQAMDLRGTEMIRDFASVTPGTGGSLGGKFSVGYANLHRFVRRPGIESDYHLLTPMEFHADTTELVQLLQKGHHGVQLDAESWDRILTWIDLNTPYHGTWSEATHDPSPQRQRRRELRKLYAGIDEDPEAIPERGEWKIENGEWKMEKGGESGENPPASTAGSGPTLESPPSMLHSPISNLHSPIARTVDLGNGVTLDLVLIPAGECVLGDGKEAPLRRVRIAEPFWMGRCEVSNEQFARFDPTHDSHIEDKNAYQFGVHGYPVNQPRQPVVRVSYEQAQAFCRWLSERTGETFALPTEEQWEYACRAGTSTPFFYGDLDTDFSPFANLADAKLREFASDPYTVDTPLPNPTPYDDWIPKDPRFNDGGLVTMPIGSYRPNPWGLYDMHGNVWEWTCTARGNRMIVRGGSWRDRPYRATASFWLSYPPYQRVFNVGFRVVGRKHTP